MATVEDPPNYGPIVTDDNGTVSQTWFSWFRDNITRKLNGGQTVTVPLAKLTGGGTNGSLEFRNGLLVSVTQPT